MTAHCNRFVTLFCLLPLLLWTAPTAAAEQAVATWHVQRDTAQLGGVEHPSVDELLEMHEGPYVLRARDGRLTKVTAAKSRLPFDPEFHPQGGIIYRAHDRLIYVKQVSIFSKSTDGGRTWTSRDIEPPPVGISEKWQVLSDGSFIRVSLSHGEGADDPATVDRSQDEGRTWTRIAEIPIEVDGGYKSRYAHWRMTKLPDDTLFLGMDLRDETYGGDRFLTAGTVLTAYRSTDGGHSWRGPIKVCESVAEGGMARLPSGRLLASVRFQRALLPTDPPEARKIAGNDHGFKHHFLIESSDDGLTWENLRPLTTVRGQCYGYPAAQSDGTVVVIHDTRYGPGPDAARAMVSRNEGRSWEDEVYYMFFGHGQSSYSQSVVLDDDTILTVGGTADDPLAKRRWEGAIGNSHLTAIRWKPVKDTAEPSVMTDRLGGVDVPPAEVLKTMHKGPYVLRARDSKLEQVPVEKVKLPHDPQANPQAIALVHAPDGTVYASLASIICKSTDGGRTWTSHQRAPGEHGIFEVLDDGSFLLLGSEGEHPDTQVVVKTSRDEGRSWKKIAEIPNPPGRWGGGSWIKRLADGTLLAGIGHSDYVFTETDGRLQLESGSGGQWAYRSTDNGRSWKRLGYIHDWFSEGGVAMTPSGRLVAAVRYQRPTLPGDPPDLEQRNGSISAGWPWKNVFLADSDDLGLTWTNVRQLTTVFGQTRGYPFALSDGTVVVVHDTRYGPGSPCSRAMISRDEGRTWEDEVYYLDFTTFTGSYNASVVLDNDVVLTVAGSSQAGNSWEAVKDNTDFFAIRWQPVPD